MEQFEFQYKRATKENLRQSIQQLVSAAAAATETAYAPYSKFKVGAAVLLTDGSIITGANQENASYPAGICAERAALSSLNLNDKTQKAVALAVTYEPHGLENKPIAPCGVCRQYMLEVELAQGSPMEVYMCGPNGEIIHLTKAADLLPFYFSGQNLPA